MTKPAAEPPGVGDLVLEVRAAPVQAMRGGVLQFALFASEETWLEAPRQFETRPAAGDTVAVTFRLPAGEYAVAIIHDENENDTLDLAPFPFPRPKEGLGVSNDDWGFGRPDYEKARFALEASRRLDVTLRYPGGS